MKKINEILGRYGVLMLLIFSILTFFNTCGTKSTIQQTNKRINNLEATINYRDSLAIQVQSLEREISSLETSKEILFSWNSVVRTTQRPDDLMNQYDLKIKELRKKLDGINHGK